MNRSSRPVRPALAQSQAVLRPRSHPPLEDNSVFLEVKPGPYEAKTCSTFTQWSPEGVDDERLQKSSISDKPCFINHFSPTPTQADHLCSDRLLLSFTACW